MSFIDRLNRFLSLYISALGVARFPSSWLPFFLYAILQFIVLLFLTSYVNPIIYPVLSPLVSILGDGREQIFSHYPGLYLLLPYVYQWFRLAVGVIFEGLATGLTAVLVLRLLSPKHFGGMRLSFAFKRWPQLLICGTIITGILVLMNQFIPMLFAGQLAYSPKRQLAFEVLMRLLTVGVYAVFIYTVSAIIVYKSSIWEAFKTSFALFIRNPIFSFFLAFVPFLFTLPVSYASASTDTIIEKFSPELVFYILIIGIVIDIVVNYFITATVVKYLLEEAE